MPGKEFVDRLLRHLRQAAEGGRNLPTPERLLGELARGSGDPSHLFAMLEVLASPLARGRAKSAISSRRRASSL
jgi:hypothetical protein